MANPFSEQSILNSPYECPARHWELDAHGLNSDTSRQFPKSKSGRIAVKAINHLGDEVMKVFKA